ncbi:DUF3169 family protein [Corticicoccus populi]|uniref:DUF3169 family protein n=1 Tax=Corticicoccus populi TaxID=1812821 RepID=A0ABW5X0H6_9STAP
MKKRLIGTLYFIISAAIGLLLFIIAGNIGGDVSTDSFYMWVGIAACIIASVMIITGITQYRRLMTVAEDYSMYMDEDSYDKYRYNKHNEIQIYSMVGFVLSLISLAIPVVLIPYFNIFLFIFSAAVYFISLSFLVKTTRLVKKLYPERQLPSADSKNYADKLLAASDEGERHIMLNALYKTSSTTQISLFIAVFVLIAYSVLTGESQIFSILVLGIIMIITNFKYFVEIKEK